MCLRYAVMDMLRFGRSLDPVSLQAMHEGSRRHRQFQQELMQQQPYVAIEQSIRHEELRVSGRIDAVVRVEGELQAIEFKTVNGERFAQIGQMGPLFAHVAQLALYLELTGYRLGCLIVENRETDERREYYFRPDADFGHWLRQRIAAATASALARRLPEREISLGCRWCDRWQRCFTTEEQRDQMIADHPLFEPNPAFMSMPAAVSL